MQEPYDSDVQFKLRAEPDIDTDEPSLAAHLDDLQLEKLHHRVTLITVLIPVLIIIVLALAYFDIKKRMTQSEDTDLMEFRKLSSDLESRFSSLSLRQAALEENLAKLTREQTQITSKITPLASQLDELAESLSQLQKSAISFVPQREFHASRENLLKQIIEVSQTVNKVAETVDKADHEIETMTREIKSQIEKMSVALNGRNAQIDELQARINQQIERLNKLDRSMTQLDNSKITKADLDLALRLESLKMEQSVKARLETLQTTIKSLESKIARQGSARTPVEPSARPSATAPASSKNATPPQTPAQTSGGINANSIQEQTIGR